MFHIDKWITALWKPIIANSGWSHKWSISQVSLICLTMVSHRSTGCMFLLVCKWTQIWLAYHSWNSPLRNCLTDLFTEMSRGYSLLVQLAETSMWFSLRLCNTIGVHCELNLSKTIRQLWSAGRPTSSLVLLVHGSRISLMYYNAVTSFIQWFWVQVTCQSDRKFTLGRHLLVMLA